MLITVKLAKSSSLQKITNNIEMRFVQMKADIKTRIANLVKVKGRPPDENDKVLKPRDSMTSLLPTEAFSSPI